MCRRNESRLCVDRCATQEAFFLYIRFVLYCLCIFKLLFTKRGRNVEDLSLFTHAVIFTVLSGLFEQLIIVVFFPVTDCIVTDYRIVMRICVFSSYAAEG